MGSSTENLAKVGVFNDDFELHYEKHPDEIVEEKKEPVDEDQEKQPEGKNYFNKSIKNY